MPAIKNLLIILLIVLTPLSKAEIIVSPVMNTAAVEKYYEVAPKSYAVVQLPGKGNLNDSFNITISADNAVYKDITAHLVDADNLNLLRQGYPYSGIGYQKAIAPFVIQGSTGTPGPFYLILDNRFAAFIAKKLRVSVAASMTLDHAAHQGLEKKFSGMYARIKQKLIFPDFNIRVEPCGQVNAFSESFGNGDVHYCTEMVADVANNQGAFVFIFLHEIGHSLLGLWGVPGNNNEDLADEFATYILMSDSASGYSLLNNSFAFWQKSDVKSEAMNMITSGDRHSLSIQRIRNTQENMKNSVSFLKRWNQLIYPHTTNEELRRIIQTPKSGEDARLAQSILAQRSKLSSLN